MTLTELDLRDKLAFKWRPTIMVPRYSPLEPCRVNCSRFLMASDGLYLEAVQPWGRVVRRLWESPVPLPYGVVGEVDTFIQAMQAAGDAIGKAMDEAREYAREAKEWAGFIFWKEGEGFVYQAAEFDSDEVSVHYRRPQLPEGWHLAIDIHSHHNMAPFFSEDDDTDDSGGIRISMVLGGLNEQSTEFTWAARYVVNGFLFNLPCEED